MYPINVPYVKQFDADGNVTNPIDKVYLTLHHNRKARRVDLQKKKFRGNKKGISLTVLNNGRGSAKYERIVQTIQLADGSTKQINHYKTR